MAKNYKITKNKSGADIYIQIDDNREEVLKRLDGDIITALMLIGQKCTDYAKDLAPVAKIAGGRLRSSITYIVDDDDKTVYVGASADYGAYNELGTGKYYHEDGKPAGRPTPWVYPVKQLDGTIKFYYTHGMRARPFIKPAMADHLKTWEKIIEDAAKGKLYD